MFEADGGSVFGSEDFQLLPARSSSSPRSSWSVLPRSLVPGHFTSLIESGRSLTSKVQALVGDTKESKGAVKLWLQGQEPPLENGLLLQSVSEAFERQDAINRANAQLSKLNYMANVANYMKHKHIEKAVASGQKQLSRMNHKILEQASTIGSLNSSVTALEVDVQCTQDTCSRLDRSLRSQQDLLNTSVRENREALEQQNSILVKQQKMVESLLRQRIRHDFVVDAGLIATAIYLCNGILVDYPLQMVLTVIPNHKLRKWTRQLTKVLLIIKVASLLKAFSIKCGLHNSVGSFIPYLKEGWGFSRSQLARLLGTAAYDNSETQADTDLKLTTSALDLC